MQLHNEPYFAKSQKPKGPFKQILPGIIWYGAGQGFSTFSHPKSQHHSVISPLSGPLSPISLVVMITVEISNHMNSIENYIPTTEII